MGAPLRLMEGTIYLLCNLCHALLARQKKPKLTFFAHFCLSLFHSFLFRFWLSLFPLLPKLFPFLFIIVLIIASDISRQYPGIWLVYTHNFVLMLSLLPCRVSWAEAAKVEMGFFTIKNFCLLFREDSQGRCLVIGADEVNYGSSFLGG